MHGSFNRRTATKVKDGKVQRKNSRTLTSLHRLVIDRESPGGSCRHVVTKQDVLAFIDLIPDWDRLSMRLERVVLARQHPYLDGYHDFYVRDETGAIFLSAWDEELWVTLSPRYFLEHQDIFERLGVAHEEDKKAVTCRFTEAQARAFTLLHVFMHELGHHFDRVNQKHRTSSRGEDYAERFARARFDELYPEYVRFFGDPVLNSSA